MFAQERRDSRWAADEPRIASQGVKPAVSVALRRLPPPSPNARPIVAEKEKKPSADPHVAFTPRPIPRSPAAQTIARLPDASPAQSEPSDASPSKSEERSVLVTRLPRPRREVPESIPILPEAQPVPEPVAVAALPRDLEPIEPAEPIAGPRLESPDPAMANRDTPPAEALPFPPPERPVAPATAGIGPWWAHLVPTPQREASKSQPLDLATLVQQTILHSEHVQAISLQVKVQETEIAQANAVFDPVAFVDSRWIDTSEPVGNLLTTGGPPRLSREEWISRMGMRRTLPGGGALEIAQRLGEEDNNSVFFVPPNQATSRLTVSLNQPLLRGSGQAYNRSLTFLAIHDTQLARDRFRSELEDRVLSVVEEYWNLYYWRAVLLQQQAALRHAQDILEEIKARASLDSLLSQVQRVTAIVATRTAEIKRAEAEIRNAETRLRALTNSPLLGGKQVELLPVEPPATDELILPMEDVRRLALANRAEVDAALTRIRAAGVRANVSKNELLPSLGLVLETYVAGLEGNFDLARSLGEQFSEGAPSYTAGMVFEVPFGRNGAKARYRQQLLELEQAKHLFRDTVATLSKEVEIALREVETTWQELGARRASAAATTAEVNYLRARLEFIPGEDHQSVSGALEELFNAIDRLVRDESLLAQAHRNYAVAIAEFHRATGMLVNVQTH
jgi:outer membrane protein TolC